jgi:hypothetical protein
MGISIFVCRARSEDDVRAAIECMRAHNAETIVPVARDDEEIARLDPKRHSSKLAMLARYPGETVSTGFGKHNRGDDIQQLVTFVNFRGDVWLEFSHKGGGADTTDWLEKNNHSSLLWFGTRGKPDGFDEAPCL